MWFVNYWELEHPTEIQQDAFATYKEAEAFLDELLGNNPSWDGYISKAEEN